MTQDVEARFVADTSGFQAGMVQAATVTDAQMRRIVQYVQRATAANEAMERTAQRAAAGAKASYENVSRAAEGAARSHAGAQREILVLAHELSQGNYKRFGGSLLVLGERLDILGKIATPAGAAVGGVAAAVLGAVAALAAGAIEADRFSKSLQITGNFAGVTSTSIEEMIRKQAALTGQTTGAARETIESVAGSGLFGPQALAQVARAVGDYQRLTHASAEDAAKVFDTLAEDATAWAEKTNRAYHFITAAQFEQIKALQDAGDKQGAAALAARDLAEALEGRGTPAAGAFARAWDSVTKSVSGAVDAMKKVGAPDTLAAEIERHQKLVDGLRNAVANRGPAPFGHFYASDDAMRADLAQEKALVARLKQSQSLADNVAQSQARHAAAQQAAIEADKYAESILRGAHAISERTRELAKWDAAVAAKAAAGTPMSAADVAAGRAEIKKRYADHSQDAQQSAYASLAETVKAFNQTTQQEIERQGKLTEAQKFAISAHEALEKAKKKLTAAQYAGISASIDAAAAERKRSDQAIADSALRLKVIDEEAARQAAFEQKRYQSVASLIDIGSKIANDAMRKAQQAGMSPDDIERMQKMQEFNDALNKAMAAPGANVSELRKVGDVWRDNIAASIDIARQAQDRYNTSFSQGWSRATSDFEKRAADTAGAAEKVFNDMANGWSDALVKFAQTGTLSIKGLVDTVVADLARLEINKGLAALFGAGGSGAGAGGFGSGGLGAGVLTGAAGMIGNSGFASAVADALDFFPTFANGLDYVPYDGFPAILHEGEKVTRRQDAATERAGGATHVHLGGLTVHVADGVSRSEMYAAAKQAQQSAVAEVMRYAKVGKVVGA